MSAPATPPAPAAPSPADEAPPADLIQCIRCGERFPPGSPEQDLRYHAGKGHHRMKSFDPLMFQPAADRTALALAALDAGDAVYPIHPVTNLDMTPLGKRNATRDRKIVMEWWSRWPWALPGTTRAANPGKMTRREALALERWVGDERNAQLKQVAIRLLREGQTPNAVEAVLRDANRSRCQPPLADAEVTALAQNAREETQRGSRETSGRYFFEKGKTWARRKTKDGDVVTDIANFTARIVEEVTHDDGEEEKLWFHIDGESAEGYSFPRAQVPVGDFVQMNWPTKKWGRRANIRASSGAKDQLREAIQDLSFDAQSRIVYAHSGWRNIGGFWYYLHAGGAIGESGAIPGVEVTLPGKLASLKLPDPPAAESPQLRESIDASLSLLDVSRQPAVGVVLAGAAYRAMLAEVFPVTMGIWLQGKSGSFKSMVAALAQAHYGDGFDGKTNLPANWASTPNSIERTAFIAKDAPLVIDDFVPKGTAVEVARLQAAADRIFRGAANQQGRGRMNADNSLRDTYVSRAFCIATAEEMPEGASLKARLIIVDMRPGEVDRAALAGYQATAKSGAYARAMAGYARWLAPRLDSLRGALEDRANQLRSEFWEHGKSDLHARTPDALASLMVGWETFLQYAQDDAGLPEAEAQILLQRVKRTLIGMMANQVDLVGLEDPVTRFIDLVRGALNAGHCHVTDLDGAPPANPQACGWVRTPRGILDPNSTTLEAWAPKGSFIGFMPSRRPGLIWLIPKAAYAAAQDFAHRQREPPLPSSRMLWNHLVESGYLIDRDSHRGNRFGKRRKLSGATYTFLEMRAEDFGGQAIPHQADLTQFDDDDTTEPTPKADPAEIVLDVVDELLRKAGAHGEATRSDIVELATQRGLDLPDVHAALAKLARDHQLVETRENIFSPRKVKWS